MSAVVNARDVLLQAASPRLEAVALPYNISVSKAQLFGLSVAASALTWRVDSAGAAVNASITLTATLPTGATGFVTWSKTGTGSTPPAAGSTNTWTIYAADQTGDSTSYTATFVSGTLTYADTIVINRVADGVAGERGPTGVPGTITGYGAAYGISTSAWSDGLANRVIRNMLTGETLTSTLATTDHLLLGDTVTLSNGTNFAETRFWNGAGAWLSPGVVIDGNLLVNGTVSATKVTAGSIVTGQSANSRVNIGDTTFIGTIKSPLHVSKVAAAANQALITALNDQDESVAMWGATAGQANGNAVAGTWHTNATEVNNTRWQMIGVLGSGLYGGAVAGNAYGTGQGGAFRYYSGSSSAAPGTQTNAAGLATATHAVSAAGPVELTGTASPLLANGSTGTSGQVLKSNGPGATPTWQNESGGSVTYANVQTAVAGATSVMSVSSTVRATGLNTPASGAGVEVAYGTVGSVTGGWITSYDRTAGAYKPLTINATSVTFDNGTVNFVNNPTITASGYTNWHSGNLTNLNQLTNGPGYVTSSGSVSFASSAGNANTVGNKRVVGGSGTAGTISTGLSSVEGFSATAIDPYYATISSVSGGSVTVVVRDAAGTNAGAQAIRWTATGT